MPKMPAKNTYSRKISSEEEREGYFLILKNKLSAFPVQGQSFNLVSGTTRRKVSIESYPCQCRGPEEPHEHYFIRWPGLRKGQKLEVSKSLSDNDDYRLTLV